MLRVSPITSVVLKSGIVTFFAKVRIGKTFFTATDGLVSINIRKERSIDNQISANDFQIVFVDDPSNDVYFNPSFPTYPEIMNSNSPVEVYLGYGRWTGTGDKKNINNHILQWFKVIAGVTSNYSYTANGRQLSISCLDRIEELANYGNFNSVTLEYMTPRDILNIIANNPRSPPVGLQNMAHNGHFEIRGDVTKYPKNWGALTKKSGFNKFYHANNRLPRYWKPDLTQFSEKFYTSKKDNDETYIWNKDFYTFDSLNGAAINKTWKDSDGDGLADWWQTESGSSYSIEKKSSISDTKIQVISGAALFKFYQQHNRKYIQSNDYNYSITGTFKCDNLMRFVLMNGNRDYQAVSQWYTPTASYQELGAVFNITGDNFKKNSIIIPAVENYGGKLYVEDFDFNLSNNMVAPKGSRVEQVLALAPLGESYEAVPAVVSKIVNTSIDGLKKSWRLSGTSGNNITALVLDGAVLPTDKIQNGTIDFIYKTQGSILAVVPALTVNGIIGSVVDSVTVTGAALDLTTNWKYSVISGDIVAAFEAYFPEYSYKSVVPKLLVYFSSATSTGHLYIDRFRYTINDYIGNPCFLDSNGDGVPNNYERIRSSTEYYTLIDSGNYLNMSQSVSFNSSSKNGQCILRKRFTDLEHGDIFTLLGHYTSENIETNGSEKSGLYAAVHAYNSSGANIYSLYSPKISGFTQWNRFEIPFRFDDRITDVDVQLCMQNADGRGFFNDVFLLKKNKAYSEEQDYAVRLSKDASDILNDKVVTASHSEWDTLTVLNSGPNISPFRTLEGEFAIFDKFKTTNPTTFAILDSTFESPSHGFTLVSSPTSGYNFVVTFDKEESAILGKNCLMITSTGT